MGVCQIVSHVFAGYYLQCCPSEWIALHLPGRAEVLFWVCAAWVALLLLLLLQLLPCTPSKSLSCPHIR
jgi:hypothetical protein